MPPKKLTTQELFDLQVYDYLVRKNMQNSAATFAREAGLNLEDGRFNPDLVPGGLLKDWFDINSDIHRDLFTTTNHPPQAAAERTTAVDRILKDLTPREVKVQVPEPSTCSTREEVTTKLQDLDEASSGMNQQKKKRKK